MCRISILPRLGPRLRAAQLACCVVAAAFAPRPLYAARPLPKPASHDRSMSSASSPPGQVSYLTAAAAAEIDEKLMGGMGYSLDQLMVSRLCMSRREHGARVSRPRNTRQRRGGRGDAGLLEACRQPCVCAHTHPRACVRACVRVRMRGRARMCMYASMCVRACVYCTHARRRSSEETPAHSPIRLD